jgi:DNA-directed RNA polymerase specialized sigma24 family protein
MRDMIAKGRRVERRGEQVTTARLTVENVRAIRQRRAEGWIYTRIAADFGIDQSTVAQIVKRKTWQHVP